MNSLRCVGLLLAFLLSACDADKAPAPPPKVSVQPPAAASDVVTPQTSVAPVAELPAKVSPETLTHELKPNVAVVPVIAGTKSDPVRIERANTSATTARVAATGETKPNGNAKSAKVKADNAEIAHRAPVANKSKSPAQVVKETRLPKAALDLSLPAEMVKQLDPPANVVTAGSKSKPSSAGGKPLLPKMFPDADSNADFQLQGRLISNEMELQLRNEARREVDGAALDFKFRQ